MERIDLLGLRRLGFFYAPPLGEREEKLGWHKKNRQYLLSMIAGSVSNPSVRTDVFGEIERLAGCFPEEPEGSFANLFVCRAATKLASYWEAPALAQMLSWDQVLNGRDTSLISILLDGVTEKGCAEDVAELEVFHQKLGRPERLYYQESGNGPFIELPGMVRLRERVKKIIITCLDRGLRQQEAARIEAGVPAGALRAKGFLWPGAGLSSQE